MTKEQRESAIVHLIDKIVVATGCPAVFGVILRDGCVGFKNMDDQQLHRVAQCWDVDIDGTSPQRSYPNSQETVDQ